MSDTTQKIARIRTHIAEGGRAQVQATGMLVGDENISNLGHGDRVELLKYRAITSDRGRWYGIAMVNL